MAVAKQALNFKHYEETDVLLDSLRREFDVRANSTLTERTAVAEMRLLGLGTRRPPYVTIDLVICDGRHYTDGYELQVPRPITIRARMLTFSWDDLTPIQKAEVIGWSLKQNMPDPETGWRVEATTDDIIGVIVPAVQCRVGRHRRANGVRRGEEVPRQAARQPVRTCRMLL